MNADFCEIERKFLVKDDSFKTMATAKKVLSQGYLSRDPKRTVRVRICDDKGYLTIKGETDAAGLSRFEWEKEIPEQEAQALLRICLPTVIEKERYIVPYKGMVFEVDVFHGIHEGLVLAEVELRSETQAVTLPPFIGKEVTGNQRYYNSYLSQKSDNN